MANMQASSGSGQAPVTEAQLSAVREALADIPQLLDPKLIRLKSRDFYWYSPILKAQLDACMADIVVQPRDQADVIRIAACAARHGVPVTVRGGGTGNYGQCVPLFGGIVVDMTGLNRILEVTAGRIRVEAGAKVATALKAAQDTGQQMMMFPSTLKVATVGGFVAGGRGGIGSARYGTLMESGSLHSVRVVTVEPEPRVLELTGEEAASVHHAWGTNGILTEVELALVPAREWAHCLASFPTYGQALAFASATMASTVEVFLLSVVDGRFKPYYEQFGDYFRGGAMVLSMVNPADVERFFELATQNGGTRSLAQTAHELESMGLPLTYECAYNHTTLRALRLETGLTYLQVLYPDPLDPSLVDRQIARYGEEMFFHHEFARRGGHPRVSCLPLVKYRSLERLRELSAQFEADGCIVMDVHQTRLDNRDIHGTAQAQERMKAIADPLGLMNPGKQLLAEAL